MIGEAWRGFMEETAAWGAHAAVLRLLIVTLVGLVIGVDREFRNKGTGIKTHVLVCIGAAMAMIVSEYVLHQFPDARGDINRMGAQGISGVGFLGASTLFHRHWRPRTCQRSSTRAPSLGRSQADASASLSG